MMARISKIFFYLLAVLMLANNSASANSSNGPFHNYYFENRGPHGIGICAGHLNSISSTYPTVKAKRSPLPPSPPEGRAFLIETNPDFGIPLVTRILQRLGFSDLPHPLQLSSSTATAINQIKEILLSAKPIVEDPKKLFSCFRGGCFSCTSNLQQFFKIFGIRTTRLKVNHAFQTTIGGRPQELLAYHYFLVTEETDTRAEIIIDPTFLQFQKIHNDRFPIFVGTRMDLGYFLKKVGKGES